MKLLTSMSVAAMLLFSTVLSPYTVVADGSSPTCDAKSGNGCSSTERSSDEVQLFTMDHDLFNIINRFQLRSRKEFGRILDAGTGLQSFRWVATIIQQGKAGGFGALSASEYTAVTASAVMFKTVVKEALKLKIFRDGKVIQGSWEVGDKSYKEDDSEGQILQGEMYDTILADYLLGSVDGFSPYYQDLLYPRLVQHLKPGGRLYITGLEPVPDIVEGDADVMCRVRKVRDACILLKGDRPYREYPLAWTLRHLEKAGLKVIGHETVPFYYDHNEIMRHIYSARSTLDSFPSEELAREMRLVLDELEEESEEKTKVAEGGKLQLGFNYVIATELPVVEQDDQ